jgi:hypothetical protein
MIKEAAPHELPGNELLVTEAPPAGPTVLVGVFFILFAQILYVLPPGAVAF